MPGGRVRDRRFALHAALCLRVLPRRHLPTATGERLRRRAYALLMRTIYMSTAGSSDPTRASIPLHLAVNGSVEVGHDVGVVLAGDATELLRTAVRDRLEGVGVPPVRDLLAKARQHNLPIYV
jgi:predicted peroxiredoxin